MDSRENPLFPEELEAAPLAERVRPEVVSEFVGQAHIMGPGAILRRAIESGQLFSVVFWGPPGTGKTTLARLMARAVKGRFLPFSAVTSGIKEIKTVMEEADQEWRLEQRPTVLFVDEIHRFNKAQQDAFLPYIERGCIVLVGATTENPSFEINSALLSRIRVLVLKPLSDDEIRTVIRGALESQRGLAAHQLSIDSQALEQLVAFANGDARVALNALELASHVLLRGERVGLTCITSELLVEVLQKKAFLYDKSGEEHFNLISALHKSLRNSDVQASLYWLVRMIEGGEDPLYVARRLVRFAVEDIGLADPKALDIALAAKDAFHFLGPPEGNLALAQAAAYLASCPKSNSLYEAWGAIAKDLESDVADPVPLHIRNAPTRLMKGLGYGAGYRYAHDAVERVTDMSCLPDRLRERTYWKPVLIGFEKTVAERFEKWEELRREYARKKRD